MSICRVVPLWDVEGPTDPAPAEERWANALHRAGERMWEAWRSLPSWEDAAATEFGAPLGELVLLLWWVHRFTGSHSVVLAQDFADHGARDPLLEDVAETAFALGAAWAHQHTVPRSSLQRDIR